jgi:hypothetical protein
VGLLASLLDAFNEGVQFSGFVRSPLVDVLNEGVQLAAPSLQ